MIFWTTAYRPDHVLPGRPHCLDGLYVRNIKANPAVRVRVGGRWRTGTAHLLPDDDPVQRLGNLPRLNSAMVRLMGSDLLTIRVDLD